MEPLDAVDVPKDGMEILNLLQQELNASALTTDLRQGVLPDRSVKATEIVESSQSITSVFNGISKNIEQSHIVHEVTMAWMTIAQNLDMLSKEELISMFGIARGTEISQLDAQDVFVQTVNGYRFKVSGIQQTIAKGQDFRKFTTLLQTISSSELLIEEFLGKNDMGKLLDEIVLTLGIDKSKIALDENQQAAGGLVGRNPTQDMASVPAADAAPSAFAEVFGEEPGGMGMGGPQ